MTGAPGQRNAAGAHCHHAAASADIGKLAIALALILAFMCAEVAVGILASSLALLSDAAHMLTDAAAIALSLVAIRLARRPARGAMTYGLGRAEVLSAQFNGATLLVLSLLIIYEAIQRLVEPPAVNGTAMLAVALIGIVVNLAATWTLSKANRQSMSVEGSYQHILTDLLAFIATAIAAAIIIATGFNRADGIASLLIAAIMLGAAYRLLRDSGRVFLEAAPRGLDPEAIGQTMAAQPGVVEVHDLHVWELTAGFPALSAHVLVACDNDCEATRRALEALLRERFGLRHTTLQLSHQGGELLQIETGDRGDPGGVERP